MILVKINRLSGWLLIPLFLIYIITGYSMTGEYGMNKVVSLHLARTIHLNFSGLFILLFLLHVCTSIYLALRRWGIIRRK